MSALLRKAAAFIRRDFRIESGYKMNFALQVIDSMLILFFFFFLSKIVDSDRPGQLSRYGGNYLAFVVIGLAFARYFQLTLRMFSDSIRMAQVTGCLEAMLSSQTGAATIVLLSSLYGLISGTIQLLIILVAGALFMAVDFSQMNVFATILVFLFSMVTFVAFGVLSAAAILWLKKGDPLTWIMGGMGSIVGGAFFPVDVLPVWLQKAALFIPITHALDALRLTMLQGASLEEVGQSVLILGAMAVVLVPVSLVVFTARVRQGRKDGTLMQY